MAAQPATFVLFCVILFNSLTQEKISVFCVPPSLICLLELYVCLLVVHSFIHPSTSKQYTMFPRQDVIVAVLQRIIRLNLNIQRKRELNLLTWHCRLLLSGFIVPHRNSQPHLLFLFPLFAHFTPSLLCITFPLLLYGRTDRRYVSEFHLTCLLLSLWDNGPFTSTLAAQCRPAGRKLWLKHRSCYDTQRMVSLGF